jgi:hypothetical protein
MDSTPDAAACRDSRSLSVEAAQYDAEAGYAEAQIRQLEEKMMTALAKANQARLQKQQAEAAEEDAFQQEREERQAIVRKNITDHHIQGMRKAIKLDHTQHLINDLKKVAAGDFKFAPNATTFVGAMVLRELVGHDDRFLAEIAGKVLANPVVIPGNGLQHSQGHDVRPKHQISPKLAPTSPSPTTKSPRLLPKTPQLSFTSPGLTLHEEDKFFALGNDGIGATGSLQGNHEDDAGENSLLTTEAAVETPETLIGSKEQGEAEVGAIDVDVDVDEKTSTQQVVLVEGALKVVVLDKENDTATEYFDDENSPVGESFDTMAGIEYSAEHDEVPASNADAAVFKQEPSAPLVSSNAINAIAALARLKRQSTETASSRDSEIVPSPLAVFRRAVPITQEVEPTISHPQIPQPATPKPTKKLAGLDVQRKAANAGRKPSGKRKRNDSEVSIPAARESGEITRTPAKKSKTKAKDENAGELAFVTNFEACVPY